MNANEAALTMSLEEYCQWWYKQLGEVPPAEGERLTVAQERDERLIRDGYYHRRTHLKPRETCA